MVSSITRTDASQWQVEETRGQAEASSFGESRLDGYAQLASTRIPESEVSKDSYVTLVPLAASAEGDGPFASEMRGQGPPTSAVHTLRPAAAEVADGDLVGLTEPMLLALRLVLDNDELSVYFALQALIHASNSLVLADWLAQSRRAHVASLLRVAQPHALRVCSSGVAHTKALGASAHVAPCAESARCISAENRTTPPASLAPPRASASLAVPSTTGADAHGYCRDVRSPRFAQRLEAVLVQAIRFGTASANQSSSRGDDHLLASNFPGQWSVWTSDLRSAAQGSANEGVHHQRLSEPLALNAVGEAALTLQYIDVDPVRADRLYARDPDETDEARAWEEAAAANCERQPLTEPLEGPAVTPSDTRNARTKWHPLTEFDEVTRQVAGAEPGAARVVRSFVGSVAYCMHFAWDTITRVSLLRIQTEESASCSGTDDQYCDNDQTTGQEVLVFETAQPPRFSAHAVCPMSKHYAVREMDDWTPGGAASRTRRWMIVAEAGELASLAELLMRFGDDRSEVLCPKELAPPVSVWWKWDSFVRASEHGQRSRDSQLAAKDESPGFLEEADVEMPEIDLHEIPCPEFIAQVVQESGLSAHVAQIEGDVQQILSALKCDLGLVAARNASQKLRSTLSARQAVLDSLAKYGLVQDANDPGEHPPTDLLHTSSRTLPQKNLMLGSLKMRLTSCLTDFLNFACDPQALHAVLEKGHANPDLVLREPSRKAGVFLSLCRPDGVRLPADSTWHCSLCRKCVSVDHHHCPKCGQCTYVPGTSSLPQFRPIPVEETSDDSDDADSAVSSEIASASDLENANEGSAEVNPRRVRVQASYESLRSEEQRRRKQRRRRRLLRTGLRASVHYMPCPTCANVSDCPGMFRPPRDDGPLVFPAAEAHGGSNDLPDDVPANGTATWLSVADIELLLNAAGLDMVDSMIVEAQKWLDRTRSAYAVREEIVYASSFDYSSVSALGAEHSDASDVEDNSSSVW